MIRARFTLLALTAAAICAIALIVLALLGYGQAIAQGWLCAFVLVSMPCIGSLVLLLTHGLTGGRWGSDLAPFLVPAARCTPFLLLLALPILVFRASIYPWPPGSVHEDVARLYLNAPSFDARTIAALAIWSALAWFRAWRRPLWSGLGLSAHLVIMTFIPADWILTLEPHAQSTGFGFGFAVEQVLAALSVAAIIAPQGDDARANRDLAGMMLSALLGTIYFVYVQFAITWYGNVPKKVEWYATRMADAWPAVAAAAFALGAVAPFFMFTSPAVRSNRRALRVAGICGTGGISLHVAWLTVPAFPTLVILPGAAAVGILILVLMAASRMPIIHSQVPP